LSGQLKGGCTGYSGLMFRKILVANRGEIAVRVIRACKEMGIGTVAVYSEADRESMHVRLADESVCIGRAEVAHTYLNVSEIIIAAKSTGADAIHPGYGLLSENHSFAETVDSFGIVFIGPSSETIRKMGDKVAAIQTAIHAGVPVIPGSHGPVRSDEDALIIAEKTGLPLLIKAASGGGGKGMRIVDSHAALDGCIHAAPNEARSFFGNDDTMPDITYSHYDSLIAKLIVHDETRDRAIQRMVRALDEFRIEGIKTTIPLHIEIIKNDAFRRGEYTTKFMTEHFNHISQKKE